MVNLDPDAPLDPKIMVQDTDYYALCERVTREDPDSVSVPLRVGATMRCDDYGAFGLAWKSALNLRKSYMRAERYWLVLTSVSAYEVVEEGESARMVLHREGPRRLGLRISNEQTLVAITEISREVSRMPFRPEAVYFKHPAPESVQAHEAYFGCPVNFGADRDAIQVSYEALESPNKLADAAISGFFDGHLDQELSGCRDDSSMTRRVRVHVTQALSEGVPSVSEIANRLNLSARTLQRRLSDQGLSFQAVVDDSRRELAMRLLKKTEYTLNEIAFLTGFSEQSAFTRAFKRWAGQTPRSFRLSSIN